MQSVQTLMTHIIDYAGLFPPARLDMAHNVSNYAAYVVGDEAWMLGRLIIPAARLAEFEVCATGLLPSEDDAEPWHISALVAPADDDRLEPDLARIEQFNAAHLEPVTGLAVIDAIELRAGSSSAIDDALDLIPGYIAPFFELPLTDGPDLRGLITALAGTEAAAKVRTGGVTPELFPDPADLARFIDLCAQANVPFKATAGLHHPLRHESANVAGAREFGFFNIFIGAGLSRYHQMPEADLAELLADEDADNFGFHDDHVTWGGFDASLSLEQIEATRSGFARSYGSCSFVEPLDDLRGMNLL